MWEPAYHYNAALSPILALAALDGLARIAGLVKFERVRRACVLLVAFGILLVNLYLLPTKPLWALTSANSWRLSDTAKDGHDALKVIPRNATVVAQVNIAPHLTHRRGIYIIYPDLPAPEPDYAIASSHVTHYPHESFQEIADYITRLEQKGYVRVFDRNGWVVVKRPLSSQAPENSGCMSDDSAFMSPMFRLRRLGCILRFCQLRPLLFSSNYCYSISIPDFLSERS